MIKEIYLAGGCFWGTEQFFRLAPGVLETRVGYANGVTIEPSYQEVCTGQTQHAETVYIRYDAERLPLEKLLELYYQTIDPTSLNKQGGDVGTQYRTGIYWVDQADEASIRASLESLQRRYSAPLVVECQPLICFYSAEEYHQCYLEKNPQGYCHIRPELFRLAMES